tara:strand:- start:2398 stop:2547 length:150 start_codon:yes stop_codon:yes gene_type:complete
MRLTLDISKCDIASINDFYYMKLGLFCLLIKKAHPEVHLMKINSIYQLI